MHCLLFSHFVLKKKKQKKLKIGLVDDLKYEQFREYSNNLKKFIGKFCGDWVQHFCQSRKIFKLYIEKQFKTYIRSLKRQEIVLSSKSLKRVKIRPYFDSKNKYSLVKPCRKESSAIKNPTFSKSPEKILLRSFSMAYFESILEHSGELYSPNSNEVSESEITQIDEEIESEKITSPQIIECERITIKGSYFGNLEINGSYLVYTSEGKKKPKEPKFTYSALEFTELTKECRRIWESNEISEVICRRFLHQHTAIEVYLKSGKSYYFNVFDCKTREELFASLKKWKNVSIIPKITSKDLKKYTSQ